MKTKVLAVSIVLLVVAVLAPRKVAAQRAFPGPYYSSGYSNYYGYGPNTSALGAHINNKLDVTVWNSTTSAVEIYLNSKKAGVVKPGKNLGRVLRGASAAAGLLSSNLLPEQWFVEVMVTVKNGRELVFHKISNVTPNQSSFSSKSITLVVKEEEGKLAVEEVDDN